MGGYLLWAEPEVQAEAAEEEVLEAAEAEVSGEDAAEALEAAAGQMVDTAVLKVIEVIRVLI